MAKVLCIGHITFDTFLKVEDAEIHCDINGHDCKVTFGFGAKIPVKEVFYSTGGGAANVGVGLSKFGHNVYIATTLGNDSKSEDILESLSENSINTDFIERDDNPSDQASIVSYEVERTIFTYGYPRKYSIKNINGKFSAVYLSSVGSEVGQLYKEVIQMKKEGDFTELFYNPGSREIKTARSEIMEILEHVDHLIVNVEEGLAILNPTLKRSDVEIDDLMDLLGDKGPNNIVLTDADNGAYIWSKGEFFHVPAIKTEVIEKTGAGDAFGSAYTAAILYGHDIEKAAKFGAKNGASVVKVFGAQNGLLDKKDLEKDLGVVNPLEKA